MANWIITKNNNGLYPSTFLVDDDTIQKSDAEIDAELPSSASAPGTVIFNADNTVKKRKGFDGSWVSVVQDASSGTEGSGTGAGDQTPSEKLSALMDSELRFQFFTATDDDAYKMPFISSNGGTAKITPDENGYVYLTEENSGIFQGLINGLDAAARGEGMCILTINASAYHYQIQHIILFDTSEAPVGKMYTTIVLGLAF